MHRAATHQSVELDRLEQATGLTLAGFLHASDCLVPVLLRPRPFNEQCAIISKLNDRTLHMPSPSRARRRVAA